MNNGGKSGIRRGIEFFCGASPFSFREQQKPKTGNFVDRGRKRKGESVGLEYFPTLLTGGGQRKFNFPKQN